MKIQYLEIVTDNVKAVCAAYSACVVRCARRSGTPYV
jgi:hypothetical protein